MARGGGKVVAALVAACLWTGCVSARPWRACEPPCNGRQLTHAGTVLVDTNADSRVLHTHATAGSDEHGPYLAGDARIGGRPIGPVKIYADSICAVHTRRVEPGRVAANVVLVPLAVFGEVLLDYWGAAPFDWDWPTEPMPASCHPPEQWSDVLPGDR
jgi:hypothetical protein